jgi:glycosyltransferase involved in cell wall biosynthesis
VNGVLWFAREVLPLIHRQIPEARFVVVGKNPPPEVLALAADPRITVTGYVADPMPYLETADAFVVPLHAGGGMRVKILDAWSQALPIVSTSIGAEGIDIRDQENILIADSIETFTQSVQRALGDLTLNQALRQNGRRWVEQKYDWRKVYAAWDKIYP